MKFSAAGGWFGGDHYNRYREAAKYGFKGVEQLSWLGLDFDKVRAVQEETGVVSTAIVIQSVDENVSKLLPWSHGMVWEDASDAFVTAFKESVAAAKAMGVPNIIATTGNERHDVPREKQHEIVVNTLKRMAPIAEEAGIMIILEPLNILVDHKGYYLVTSAEGYDMIREVGSPNCKLLFDIYHQQISEGNLIKNIRAGIDLIGHFHIGDHPGRNEPGTGEINYKNVFKAIKETGYDRWLAFECGRTVDVETLSKNMHELIDEFDD